MLTLPNGDRLPVAVVRRLLAEQKPAAIEQPLLFEVRVDARPAGTRSAAERYEAPSLFTLLET